MLRSSVLLVIALGAGSPALGRVGEAEGLSSADWCGIRAAWDAGRHAAFPAEDGWRARNPGQGWDTLFDGRGVRVRPDAGGWEWGLELERWGFAGAEHSVSEPLRTRAHGQRVAYDWGETLEEWYVNDAHGLEHGFTVRERPLCENAAEAAPLTFTLAVRGELRARIESDGRGARFENAQSESTLTYAGLTAFDADGTPLDARLESVGHALRIVVDERGARYPLTIDPYAQQAYLKASNTGSGDNFGWSVAASGNRVVVGAPREDSSATGVGGDQTDNSTTDSGAAYVFVRQGKTWSQEAYLKASNPDSADQFGWSVAISGDTLVVGAYEEDSAAKGVNGLQSDNSLQRSGAAYVFVHDGSSWSQQAYLKASNTGTDDYFGWSVAVSGDTALIGARLESSAGKGVNGNENDNTAFAAGAAYVFVRAGTSWSQQAYLKASNTDGLDNFGYSVAVSGDTVVVGAPYEDSNAAGVNGDEENDSSIDSGAAYVFVRESASWSQSAYLKPSVGLASGDGFGISVAVSGTRIAVGAWQEDSFAQDSGAAYVFAREGITWSQEAFVKDTNPAPGFGSHFGVSVGISGDVLAVGAEKEDRGAAHTGAAYVYRRTGGVWIPDSELVAPDPEFGDRFGWSVAASGSTVVVGSFAESSSATGVNGDPDNNGALFSGAAYAFVPAGTVGFRNAGANQASYTADPPVIGEPFTATVDNNLSAQLTSRLFAFEASTSVVLAGGQTLLCLDLGSGELFAGSNLAPSSSAGGIDSYSLPVPNDPSLPGVAFSSQAIQFGLPPFSLSNAQDLTIGGI